MLNKPFSKKGWSCVKPDRSCLSTIPSLYTSNMNTGTHKNGWKCHFGEFLFCGYVCLFETSCWKGNENRGSMRFGVRQDHCEEQWKTLILKKLTCSRVVAFSCWGLWARKYYKNRGLEWFAGSWPGTGGGQKNTTRGHTLTCVFFLKNFDGWIAERFSAKPRNSAWVFFSWLDSERVMWSKTLNK